MYGDILNESLLYSSNGSVADMNPFWQNFSQYANTTVENYDGEFAKILHVRYLFNHSEIDKLDFPMKVQDLI